MHKNTEQSSYSEGPELKKKKCKLYYFYEWREIEGHFW